MKNYSVGAIVAASLVGLAAGLAQPLGIAVTLVFVPGTVITAVLFAWAGYIPAMIFTAASLLSLSGIMGAPLAAAYALLTVVPAGVLVGMTVSGQPFARRMMVASAAQVASIVVLIVALYALVRQDLVEALIGFFSETINNLGDLKIVMLQMFALSGTLEQSIAQQVLAGTVTQTQAAEILARSLKTLGEAMRLTLSGILLSSGLLTGILAAGLSGKILSRRGEDETYLTLDRWFMPRRITICAIVGLATGYALALMAVDGAEAVFNTFQIAAVMLYTVGGAACLSRRMKASGRRPGVRAALIVVGILFAQQLVMLIGVASALFGQRGVISSWFRKKADERKNKD